MDNNELTFKERMDLAVCVHGLYTFPLADPADALAAMDNWGIPFLRSQLRPKDVEVLEKLAAARKAIPTIRKERPTWKCTGTWKCDRCGKGITEHENQMYCPT